MEAETTFTAGLELQKFENSQGITTYYDLGEKSNPVVVLIPGYLCSGVMYKDLALHLVEKGFRVITYDPFGTGGSVKRDDKKYDLETILTQFESLIEKVAIKEMYVVGYSMGGVISSNFVQKHREMVKRILFISPAGISLNLGPQQIIDIMCTPVEGPNFVKTTYGNMLMDAVKINFVHPDDPKIAEFLQFQYTQIYNSWKNNESFADAACGILKDFPFTGCEENFKSLQSVKSTVILARQDVCVGFDDNSKFWEGVEGTKMEILEDCGHWAIAEKSAEMFALIDKAFC